MKYITLLGATGTIGAETCEIIKARNNELKLYAAIANSNWQKLVEIGRALKPKYIVIQERKFLQLIQDQLKDTEIIILGGEESVYELTRHKVDIVVAGISGFAGLKSLYCAIEAGQKIALANKEAMICAGHLLTKLAKKCDSLIIPVDSEHNAIWQVFETNNIQAVDTLWLTATGGPFWNMSTDNMKNITLDDALKHPKWNMGKKITVDSATMLNKGFEMIEAFFLFKVTAKQIKTIVHPQAIVHSMVSYIDGTILAQLSIPDMKIPISYAVDYPERHNNSIIHKIDFTEYMQLEFFPPNYEKFPCLKLAHDILLSEQQKLMIALNAASEIVVESFLRRKIHFTEIYIYINKIIDIFLKQPSLTFDNLSEIIAFDNEVRRRAEEILYHV